MHSSVRIRIAPGGNAAASPEEAHLRRLINGLSARMHDELLVDFLDVGGNRVRRDLQELRNLGEAESLGDERQGLGFARRQLKEIRRRCLCWTARCPELLEKL